MPYKLHRWDYEGDEEDEEDEEDDPGWPRRYTKYDHRTACRECHSHEQPNGALRVLQHVFRGLTARCRHHHNRYRGGSRDDEEKGGIFAPGGWGGNVRGIARRKGCRNTRHYAIAFRSDVDTDDLPSKIDVGPYRLRMKLPEKCNGRKQKSHDNDDKVGHNNKTATKPGCYLIGCPYKDLFDNYYGYGQGQRQGQYPYPPGSGGAPGPEPEKKEPELEPGASWKYANVEPWRYAKVDEYQYQDQNPNPNQYQYGQYQDPVNRKHQTQPAAQQQQQQQQAKCRWPKPCQCGYCAYYHLVIPLDDDHRQHPQHRRRKKKAEKKAPRRLSRNVHHRHRYYPEHQYQYQYQYDDAYPQYNQPYYPYTTVPENQEKQHQEQQQQQRQQEETPPIIYEPEYRNPDGNADKNGNANANVNSPVIRDVRYVPPYVETDHSSSLSRARSAPSSGSGSGGGGSPSYSHGHRSGGGSTRGSRRGSA